MSAQEITLTNDPIQVSDGATSVFIQESSGFYTRFTATANKPDATSPYCVIKNGEISVAKGFPVWAWARDESPSVIVVLKSEV